MMDLNQDILQEICNQIGVCLDLADDDSSKAIARRTLVNAALATKAFYEPAIRALWRVLPSLVPLLKLLPSFQLINGQTYVLVEVKSHEWEKFDDRARHVRVLFLSQTRFQVSPFVYDRLRQLRKDPLLPALREFKIPANYSGDFRSSFISLSSRIRLVELHDNSIAQTEFFLPFMPAVIEEAPLVTHLILHTQTDVQLGRISDLKHLRYLDLQLPTGTLSNVLVRQVGQLESLVELRVDLGWLQSPSFKAKRRGPGTTTDGYRMLQTLLIRGAAIAMTQMMETMSFMSLSTLTLGFNNMGSCTRLFRDLAQRAAYVTNMSLQSYMAQIHCTFDNIHPLLGIHSLEILEINTESFSICEAEFFLLMSSLPNLRILYLPDSSPSTSLTARVLWQPSKLSPKLTELNICVYQSNVSLSLPSDLMEIAIPRKHAHLALRKLSISSAYGRMEDDDVIHLGRILYKAFPNLQIVKGFGSGSHYESWDRVNTFRIALMMCSKEEDPLSDSPPPPAGQSRRNVDENFGGQMVL